MTTPEAGVVITVGDMYRELRDVHDAVTKLTGALDGRLNEVTDHEARLRVIESHPVATHEARITALERTKWMAIGATGLISAALSSGAVTVILALVHHK